MKVTNKTTMKKLGLFLSAIALLYGGITQLAWAEKSSWDFLFDQDTAKFYLDKANISGEGNEKSFWLKIVVENPFAITVKPLQDIRQRHVINCTKKLISDPVGWEYRDGEGNLQESGQKPLDVVPWVSLEELEDSDQLYSQVCPAS